MLAYATHFIILLGNSPERLIFMDKRLQRLILLLVTITLVIATYAYSVFDSSDAPILAQVRNVEMETNENSVILTWEEIPYSDGYEVLCSTSNGGVSIFEVKSNAVTIEKDYISSYKVRCYILDSNGSKILGQYSPEVVV